MFNSHSFIINMLSVIVITLIIHLFSYIYFRVSIMFTCGYGY